MPKSKVFVSGPAGDITFNVVPLIDVTFVLILFLIITTQISSASFADLWLPSPLVSQIKLTTEEMDAPNRVVVNVLSRGSLKEKEDNPALSGKAKEYQIDANPFDVGDIDKLAKEFARKKSRSAERGFKEFFVEIRGDKRVQYIDVQPVLLAASKAGIMKVNITALKD